MYSYTFPNAWVTKRSIKKYEKLKSELSSSGSELLPAHRFVMFNYPRSGSNLVCGMLNQHPDILNHREVFNPQKIYYARGFKSLQQTSSSEDAATKRSYKLGVVNHKIERDIDPEGFCFKLWQHHYGVKAVGFNIFPSHVPNMSVNLVRDCELKKILLIRRNKLKCYVSREIARHTGVWDLYGKSEETEKSEFKEKKPVQIQVNSAKLLRWSKKYDEYFENMHSSLKGQDFFTLYYEDIVGQNSESVKAQLLEFIGVHPDSSHLTPPLKKQNSRSMPELISNYSQLKTALSGTNLEDFI